MDIFLEIVTNPDGFVFTHTQVISLASLSLPTATLDEAGELHMEAPKAQILLVYISMGWERDHCDPLALSDDSPPIHLRLVEL